MITKSQTTLQGTITNYEGKPIAMANILVKNANEPDIIVEFGFTQKEGKYSIKLQKEYTNLRVEVTALGYLNEVQAIEEYKNQKSPITLDFTLRKDETELKTVVVKSYKIKERNDTVFYNPKAFMDGSERKVEDMLKKLPGVEVDKNGSIKYRGKSVEAVLLDGDNIFDKSYQIGTRNINVDLVKQVQGIDKFSENPLLKGIEHTDNVALNLVLKKGETDYSGNASFHYGVTDRYHANVALLAISQAQKTFATVSYNNIGINVSPYDYFGSSSYQNLIESESIAPTLIQDGVFPTVLGEERSNINNTRYASINNLVKLKNNDTFRTNISYLNDDILAENSNESFYFLNNENIYTSNQNTTHKKPILYRADFQWKKHLGKLASLEYNGRISYENIEVETEQQTNYDNGFINNISTEHLFIKNNLLYTQKLNDKQALQATFTYNRSDKPQTLRFNRSNQYISNTSQSTQQESNFTKHLSDLYVLFLGNNSLGNYQTKLGINWNSLPFQSKLYEYQDDIVLQSEDFTNNTQYNIANAYVEAKYHLNYNRWKLTTNLIVRNNVQHLTNFTEKWSNSKVLFQPLLSLQYKKGKHLFSSGYQYNQSTLQEHQIFTHKTLGGSRSLLYNIPSLDYVNNQNTTFSYAYNDAYNQFIVNASLIYNTSDQSFMSTTEVDNVYSNFVNQLFALGNQSFSTQMGIEKYVPFLESTLKLRGNYLNSQYYNIVNSSDIRNNTLKLFMGYLFYKTAFDIPVNFQNEFSVTTSNYFSQGHFVNSNTNLNYKGVIFFKDSYRFFASITAEYFLPNTDKSNDYWFIDSEARYTTKNNKYTFYLQSKNLFNNTYYSDNQINDFSRIELSNLLLERYILVGLEFSF